MVATFAFYDLRVPIDSIRSGSASTRPQVVTNGILGDALGDAQQTSTDSERDQLQFTRRDWRAEVAAREYEELGANPSIEAAPAFDSREGSRSDGYYVIESANANPTQRQVKEAFDVQMTIRQKGTHETHWRQTDIGVEQLDHEFGSTPEAHVGIPAAATKVRWFDTVSGETAAVGDPVATRAGEFDDVDVYDGEDTPEGIDEPSLIYELEYELEGRTDPGVWDQRTPDKTNDEDDLQWQTVFSTTHEFEGLPLLDNHLLRVEFDEPDGEISAWRWDDAAGEWSAVTLGGPGDWALFDADVEAIGMAAIEAHLEFEHTDGSMWALTVRLEAGAEDLLVSIPGNGTGPVPDGIETWLDPIASGRLLTAAPSKGLVKRSEVK